MTYVAVCGPADAGEDELALAEEVGRRLGEAGAVLLCGGLGGVMDAAPRGARAAGGLSVGILPGSDRREAGAHLSVAIPTGMGETRNTILVRAADAVIAIGGGFGTLSEVALALRMETPVVGLGTWELAMGGRSVDAFPTASTSEEAVRLALRAADAQKP